MGRGVFKVSNVKKTYYYLKKNGIRSAFYAVIERMSAADDRSYQYEMPDEKALEKQREQSEEGSLMFSILVPAFETKEAYLREMVDSVLNQTYSKVELVIADASSTDAVEKVIGTYHDARIVYIRLKDNLGISGNTNAALKAAAGDYIGLLDHDDVLAPDALFEMAAAIQKGRETGQTAWVLYSDEDKCNGAGTEFYDVNRKPSLNIELLLSNNYICHFLMMKNNLMKWLGFREKYDGAQDFDLILRGVETLCYLDEAKKPEFFGKEEKTGRHSVVHIPKVLYHWRCHTDSTAENPESKRYAYEAGKRAVSDFIGRRGWQVSVENTKHLGFYRIDYKENIFDVRKDIGVIGGKIFDSNNKISGGAYDRDGNILYKGIHREFSGYMHRASLMQEVYAVDLRCMKVRRELWDLFADIFGFAYEEDKKSGFFFYKKMNKAEFLVDKYMKFGDKVRQAGYVVVWSPEYSVKIK